MDEIVHQPTRLRIMAALNALRGGETLDFSRLKSSWRRPMATSVPISQLLRSRLRDRG